MTYFFPIIIIIMIPSCRCKIDSDPVRTFEKSVKNYHSGLLERILSEDLSLGSLTFKTQILILLHQLYTSLKFYSCFTIIINYLYDIRFVEEIIIMFWYHIHYPLSSSKASSLIDIIEESFRIILFRGRFKITYNILLLFSTARTAYV